jgi:hypothetical protein
VIQIADNAREIANPTTTMGLPLREGGLRREVDAFGWDERDGHLDLTEPGGIQGTAKALRIGGGQSSGGHHLDPGPGRADRRDPPTGLLGPLAGDGCDVGAVNGVAGDPDRRDGERHAEDHHEPDHHHRREATVDPWPVALGGRELEDLVEGQPIATTHAAPATTSARARARFARSPVTTDRTVPRIGVISGATIMAPITVAAESATIPAMPSP